jgi:hypothetical protein
MDRAGKNRVHTLHSTRYLVISLPKKTYIHHTVYMYMVLANPNNGMLHPFQEH